MNLDEFAYHVRGTPERQPMKTLTLDIETVPATARVWDNKPNFIAPSQLVEEGWTLCFAAKWMHHRSGIKFFSEWDHGFEGMVEAAHRLMSEADVVVTYNGARFDIPILEWEFAKLGLGPPKPHRDIDLIRTVRRFRPFSKSLAHVTAQLEVGDGKFDSGGQATWTACCEGDERARRLMKKYCRQDVKVTEQLYFKLLPWIKNHPNPLLYMGEVAEGRFCGICAHDELDRDGWHVAATRRYPLYRCRRCQGWSKARGSDGGAPDLKSV